MTRTPILAAFLLILTCETSPAPIYGVFDTLNLLIERAEFIVVAEIVKRPAFEEFDMGGGGTFEISIVKAIKGNVKSDKRVKAYLRDLFFNIGPHDIASLTQGFKPGERYLLFLNKPGTHTNDQDGNPLPVDFENENCEGDAIWINSSPGPFGSFDLESLKGKNVRESVVALLNHTATQQQKFANAVRMVLESRNRNVLTQKIAQIVWLEKSPEEAASFYLSIFKESRKDPNFDHYRYVGPDQKESITGVKLWIDGQDVVLLNGRSKLKPTEATALTLNCDLEDEIDYYWEKLSEGGQKSHAGWVKDRFGVWWHIVPSDLAWMLGTKDAAQADRVIKAMLKMDKIDAAALRKACWGQ